MAKTSAVTIPTDPEEVKKILQRARNGDEKVLPVVRQLLQQPGAVDRLGGNLPRMAEQSLIAEATGKNAFFRESLIRQLDLLRAELAGAEPTPVERLLVDRVVACWLQLHLADLLLAQQASKFSLTQWEYHERSRDRAQKRYLSSIRMLALVRKFAAPLLQVNIARKQVNVVTPATVQA
jgi:hypothetical protein